MSQGIILLFDEKSSESLRNVYRFLEKRQLNDFMIKEAVPPHITLVACNPFQVDRMDAKLTEFSKSFSPFKIRFASVGYFPSTHVFFLNPKENQELKNLQSQLYQQLSCNFPEILDNSYYHPEAWIPHSTIASDVKLKKFPKIIEAIQTILNIQISSPFIATVIGIATFKYPPFQILKQFSFQNKENNEL